MAIASQDGSAPRAPARVAILGLGDSLLQYVTLAKGVGGRRRVADEIWGINSAAGVLQCDRVFHMDDFRVQEMRAAATDDEIAARYAGRDIDPVERGDLIRRAKASRDAIGAMLDHLRVHPGPIYTPFAHPDYPGSVTFPLEDVINGTRFMYFNNTAAYAVAYASFIGVETAAVFGCDYTYPDRHYAERGRGCLEFWLGFAAGGGGRAPGMKIELPTATTLMDTREPIDLRLYGYDMVHVDVDVDRATQRAKVSFRPREAPVTADAIEARYDHTK